jgi:dTDP-4-dehydrorhamnose reductase
MKILIIGSNGQVGREVCQALSACELTGATKLSIALANRDDLDLTETSEISKFLTCIDPDFIINASAYTDVDKAEFEEDLAFSVNAVAVGEMARHCKETGCRLIHISTDYVFDGALERPYVETDSVGPIGVYGRSKLAGENAIRKELTQHVIVRTSWVFGAHGTNFVKTMVRLAGTRVELSIVDDQFGSPTSARSIAKAITIMVVELASADAEDPRWGTYHFSGYPFVSWADFADDIFSQAVERGLIEVRPRVERITTADYPTPAQRPASSRLDCKRLKSAFAIDPDNWRLSLVLVLDELKEAGVE